MRRCLASLALLAFGGVLLAGCAAPPSREIDQAQGAIDAARAAGAERYAGEEYRAAVATLKLAQDAVGQGDYRLALNHALDSRERAQNAARQAADQRAYLRSQAERALGEAMAMLDQAHKRLAVAEAARVARRALAGPRATIASADVAVQKAGAEVGEGDYEARRQELSATTARLQAAIAELDRAIDMRAPRPRR